MLLNRDSKTIVFSLPALNEPGYRRLISIELSNSEQKVGGTALRVAVLGCQMDLEKPVTLIPYHLQGGPLPVIGKVIASYSFYMLL